MNASISIEIRFTCDKCEGYTYFEYELDFDSDSENPIEDLKSDAVKLAEDVGWTVHEDTDRVICYDCQGE